MKKGKWLIARRTNGGWVYILSVKGHFLNTICYRFWKRYGPKLKQSEKIKFRIEYDDKSRKKRK